MAYLIGTGGLGNTSNLLALKVSTGQMTLAAAQAQWDTEAGKLRTALTNQLLGASLMSLGAKLTPAQIAVDVEKKVIAKLGPRPRGTITSTNMTSVMKSPSGEVIFGGASVGPEVAGGVSVLHIVGAAAIFGLIALAIKGT